MTDEEKYVKACADIQAGIYALAELGEKRASIYEIVDNALDNAEVC